MRDGRVVLTAPTTELSEDAMANAMVGREMSDPFPRRPARPARDPPPRRPCAAAPPGGRAGGARASAMVGREMSDLFPRRTARPAQDIALRVRDLTVPGRA